MENLAEKQDSRRILGIASVQELAEYALILGMIVSLGLVAYVLLKTGA
jgi:hypothetical protein